VVGSRVCVVTVGPVIVNVTYWGTITAAIAACILCIGPLLPGPIALGVSLAAV